MALRQRYATFPGVSFPSSVVRSIMETTNFSPWSFIEVLTLRLPKALARSSAITWSIVGMLVESDEIAEELEPDEQQAAPGITDRTVRRLAQDARGKVMLNLRALLGVQ